MNTTNTLIRTLSLPSAVLAALLTASALGAGPAQAAQPTAATPTESSCHANDRIVWPKGPAKGQSARVEHDMDCERPAPAAEPAAAPPTNRSCHKETRRVFVSPKGSPGRGVPGVESRTVTACDGPAKAEPGARRDGAPQPGTYGPRRAP